MNSQVTAQATSLTALTEPSVEATATRPRRHRRGSLARQFVLGLAVPILLLTVWEVSVRLGLVEGRLMPPPSRIARVFREMAASCGVTW